MRSITHIVKKDINGKTKEELFFDNDFNNCKADKDIGTVKIRYKYDDNGNLSGRLLTLPDSSGYTKETAYTYDTENRITSETDKKLLNGETEFTITRKYIYDSRGNIIKESCNLNGCFVFITEYVYEDGSVLKRKREYVNSIIKSETAFQYDAEGALIREHTICPDGETTEKIYSFSHNKKISEKICTAKVGKTFTKTTYEDERPVKTETTYSYTQDKREITYEYDKIGRMTLECYKNNYGEKTVTRFYYDEKGYIVYSLTYNHNNELTEINTGGIKTELFRYSPEGLLVSEKTSFLDKPPMSVAAFRYDINNNLIEKTEKYSGKTFITKYTYDENNAVKTKTIINHDGTVVAYNYEYNCEGQLIKETFTDKNKKSVKWSYRYPGYGITEICIENPENAEYGIDDSGRLFSW